MLLPTSLSPPPNNYSRHTLLYGNQRTAWVAKLTSKEKTRDNMTHKEEHTKKTATQKTITSNYHFHNYYITSPLEQYTEPRLDSTQKGNHEIWTQLHSYL